MSEFQVESGTSDIGYEVLSPSRRSSSVKAALEECMVCWEESHDSGTLYKPRKPEKLLPVGITSM